MIAITNASTTNISTMDNHWRVINKYRVLTLIILAFGQMFSITAFISATYGSFKPKSVIRAIIETSVDELCMETNVGSRVAMVSGRKLAPRPVE